MTLNRHVAIILWAGCLLAGCALLDSTETTYLKSAVGQADQTEVRRHLGEPDLEQTDLTGQSRWTYEVYTQEPGSQSAWYGGSTWCDEYVLRFTPEGVLQDWSHRYQFHGGELMPSYCVFPARRGGA